MGARGPVPKRTEVRRRRNKSEDGPVTSAAGATDVPVPDPDPLWHPIAVDWFLSLKDSGQSHFYEPSDWAVARYVAEAMSNNLKQDQKMSSMMFTAVMSAMGDLLTTEGARRRARMELQREEVAEDAAVIAIADYRDMLDGA